MAKRIHFEDDIFYVNVRIRSIRDMLSLDVDSEFFAQNTMAELEFLDSTLRLLLKGLIENERFIERDEQLRNLGETETNFSALVADFEKGANPTAAALAPFAERFSDFISRSRDRRLENQVATGTKTSSDDPLVVSSAELNELLKGME